MSETVLTVEDAARTLPAVVERVHASGEAALLTQSGRPVARIVPVPVGSHGDQDLIAFLRRWRTEHPEPDEQFADAIEESRRNGQSLHDPYDLATLNVGEFNRVSGLKLVDVSGYVVS